jgi:hypothetical protein
MKQTQKTEEVTWVRKDLGFASSRENWGEVRGTTSSSTTTTTTHLKTKDVSVEKITLHKIISLSRRAPTMFLWTGLGLTLRLYMIHVEF